MLVLCSGKPEVGTGIPFSESQICVIVYPGKLYGFSKFCPVEHTLYPVGHALGITRCADV